MPAFSKKSRKALVTAHHDLQHLFLEVVKEYDCSVLCGYRGKEEQNEAYAEGNSNAKWGQSPHNNLPSLAIDVVPYPVDWTDTASFYKFAAYVLNTAMKLNYRVKWGGFFSVNGKPFFDGPHFELIREE